ncbi:MAG: DNA repair protein RadA [Patescibacteria group bacterium]
MSIKTVYSCTKCDAQFPKWQGRCPECGAWGTIGQQTVTRKSKPINQGLPPGRVVNLDSIDEKTLPRVKSNIKEFDRVVGGGIVPGSLSLIGGDPGIGKSTLVLQIAEALSQSMPGKILYVSGEESAEQVKMRLKRIGRQGAKLQFLSETSAETIVATLAEYQPKLAIIDSIQTMFTEDVKSEAGSVNQIKACTTKFLEIAKPNNISLLIIGHVTKGGTMAGPKTLEHLVDVVLYLEGDKYHAFRILRAAKNRFGATAEVGIFDMQEKGMVEVKNPSELFLKERQKNTPGSAVASIVEGTRSFLVEIQALVSRTHFGYAKRVALGVNFKRLELLVNVLKKRTKLSLANQDINVNVAGGIKIAEPAADLAICLAIYSALTNKVIEPKMVAIGEVGLAGELRTVAHLEKRINEASKLGFNQIMMPAAAKISGNKDLNIITVKNLQEAFQFLE